MKTDAPRKTRLADYTPPPWLVEDVHLIFRLTPKKTRVLSRIRFHPGETGPQSHLHLDGESLTLISARINGQLVDPTITDRGLSVPCPSEPFTWEAEVEIDPAGNTALEGLYMSGDIYCTQCEAEGFRRITYYPDRPDVMAPFTVRVECDAPVLLSNGNLVAQGAGWAEWHDPWPKPSYLFALVAGDLRAVSGNFTTMEGREVSLNVWVRPGDEDRCDFALDSLIRAMAWDEEVYGRTYDLDVFNLVAVDDFNAGAMENKGLNIFNSKYVLASPETATDGDYEGIESVVAHEYFHNWTGNRITCRDWFQLCLKEGLTVFRDQEFTSDMRSRAVKRIADVLLLRSAQFREDRGPLAHPARPVEYVEINNFYTTTVYEKGAEIVRMLHTILGAGRFHQALERYFQRHDGRAATVEEFFACFHELAPDDLKGFELWWQQAGTPHVQVSQRWDGSRLVLDIRQRTAPTPGQPDKLPMLLPFRIALIGDDGNETAGESLLVMREAREVWVYDTREGDLQRDDGIVVEEIDAAETPAPVLSINRGFSAPVVVDAALTLEDSRHLLAHDTDPFNRWDAGRRIVKEALVRLITDGEEPAEPTLDALARVARDSERDPAFSALVLRLPSDDDIAGTLADGGLTPDPDAIHRGRRAMATAIGRYLKADLERIFRDLAPKGAYQPDPVSAGRRALRVTALRFLTSVDGPRLAATTFDVADNMTETLAALGLLIENGAGEEALSEFHARWHGTPGVIDKWFAMQVTHAEPHRAAMIADRLTRHPEFNWQVPNRVRAVLGALVRNHAGFHDASGAGYERLGDWIMRLDRTNPQIAAGLTRAFQTWRRYDADRQGRIEDVLAQILRTETLSRDTREMADSIAGD